MLYSEHIVLPLFYCTDLKYVDLNWQQSGFFIHINNIPQDPHDIITVCKIISHL